MEYVIKLDEWEETHWLRFFQYKVRSGTDRELFELQIVFMSTVFDLELSNPKGMKLVLQLYKDNPRTMWTTHETYQTSLDSSLQIAILLSDRLTNMKISSSKSQSAFL